jgi:hypothetical protein
MGEARGPLIDAWLPAGCTHEWLSYFFVFILILIFVSKDANDEDEDEEIDASKLDETAALLP